MREIERAALMRIEADKEKLFGLLSELIKYDSQNLCGDGRERALAEHMACIYRSMGLETDVYCPDEVDGVTQSPLYWPGHNTDSRPNAVGLLKPEGARGRVMLMAHTDTMPVGDPAAWTVSPFGGDISNGNIYGLGAGDDKAGLAAACFALDTLMALKAPFNKEIALCAYCDEEYGGGNGALAACLRTPSDDYINLDGADFEIWPMALGGGCYRVTLTLDRVSDDCFPIYRALDMLMAKLDGFGARRRAELAAHPAYAGTQTADSAFRVARFGNLPERHEEASVDFVLYTVSGRRQIEAELREILAELAPEYAKMGVSTVGFTSTSRFFDAIECDNDSLALARMKECAKIARGKDAKVCGACLSDLSVILAAGGRSAFNFGIFRDFSLPGGAHQPDEYVSCDQLVAYTKALALFLLRHAANA